MYSQVIIVFGHSSVIWYNKSFLLIINPQSWEHLIFTASQIVSWSYFIIFMLAMVEFFWFDIYYRLLSICQLYWSFTIKLIYNGKHLNCLQFSKIYQDHHIFKSNIYIISWIGIKIKTLDKVFLLLIWVIWNYYE